MLPTFEAGTAHNISHHHRRAVILAHSRRDEVVTVAETWLQPQSSSTQELRVRVARTPQQASTPCDHLQTVLCLLISNGIHRTMTHSLRPHSNNRTAHHRIRIVQRAPYTVNRRPRPAAARCQRCRWPTSESSSSPHSPAPRCTTTTPGHSRTMLSRLWKHTRTHKH